MADIFDQIHAERTQQPQGPPPASGDIFDQIHAQRTQQQPQDGGFLHEAFVNPAKQVGAGFRGAAASANKLTANTFDLLDKAADVISKATGTHKGGLFQAIAEYTRKSQQEQEQKAQQLSGGRQDFTSQLYRGAAQGAAELPQYAVAGHLLGPTAGIAAVSGLGAADQGPAEAAKAALGGALTGGAMKVLGPGSRLLRGTVMGGGTAAQAALQGADPATALSQGITMGGMAALPPGGATVKQAAGAFRDMALEGARAGVGKIAQQVGGGSLNPVQQSAVDYARSQGVPLRFGTQTGNRAIQALEQTTASSPLGAQRAAEFNRGTEEGFQGVGGKLAEQAHREPATAESVGKAIPAKLQKNIENLSLERDAAYEKAWQGRDDPQHTYEVPVRMTRGAEVLNEATGEGTGLYEQEPVLQPVNMPVDVRGIKMQAQPIFDEMQWMPMAERSASKAYTALERILKGDDYIPAWQAEKGLSGLKDAARVTSESGVRDTGQGVAASLIKNLQGSIDEAVARTGEDAIAGLQKGRATHARVMDVADLADQLREEPVQNFGKLTQQRDTGAGFLNQIAEQAPEHMPALGRAWLQRQLDTAAQGGGFSKTTGLLNNWHKLGDATKDIMFPDPRVRDGIGNLLQAADMWGRQPNPSGTEIVRQATSLNPARWLQGYIGGKLFYTPEGIKLLTDAIKPQSPGSQALNMAKVKAAAGREGPPEEPPPGLPPEEPPTGGGPGAPPPPPPPGAPPGSGGGAAALQGGLERNAERVAASKAKLTGRPDVESNPLQQQPGLTEKSQAIDNPQNEYQYTTPEGIPVYRAPEAEPAQPQQTGPISEQPEAPATQSTPPGSSPGEPAIPPGTTGRAALQGGLERNQAAIEANKTKLTGEPAPPAAPETGGGLYDKLQQAGDAAKERLKKPWSGTQLYSLFPGDKAIDLATLTAAGTAKGVKTLANRAMADMGEWGAARIAGGFIKYPEWSKQMMEDASEVSSHAAEFLRKNMRAVYTQAQQTLKDRQSETLTGKVTEIQKILEYAEAGKEGTYWYKHVKPILQPMFGPNTDLFLNFLAATSPQTPVARNVMLALKAYNEYLTGEPFSTDFEAHLGNLKNAAAGKLLSGLKVGSFAPNLMGDFIKVTVDTWMAKAYGFKSKVSDPQYRFMDYAISQAAKAKGLEPAEMQAAIWTGIKKLEGDPRLTAAPFEEVVKQYLQENPEIKMQIEKALKSNQSAAQLRAKALAAKGQ